MQYLQYLKIMPHKKSLNNAKVSLRLAFPLKQQGCRKANEVFDTCMCAGESVKNNRISRTSTSYRVGKIGTCLFCM